jgi:hypothetical protein
MVTHAQANDFDAIAALDVEAYREFAAHMALQAAARRAHYVGGNLPRELKGLTVTSGRQKEFEVLRKPFSCAQLVGISEDALVHQYPRPRPRILTWHHRRMEEVRLSSTSRTFVIVNTARRSNSVVNRACKLRERSQCG